MDFNLFASGRGRSKYDQTGFDSVVNLDVHSELGVVSTNYALEADATSGVPDEACVQAVTPSGTIYFFSTTTGKIWKRTSAGVYSSITANTNTAHRGARYYNGKVCYWTASKFGYFTAETEASRNNSKGTFTNGNAYGSCEENLTLFITDGKYIASYNSSDTFTANALDIPAQYVWTCIVPDGNTNILIGTIVTGSVNTCRAFLWDTYSDSFTLSDEIPEKGINTFIKADELIIAQCGTQGHLYMWTGNQFTLFDNELRGETTTVGHALSTVLNGRPLIAVGTKIYSIYRKYNSQPMAIVQEYTATGSIASLETSGTFLSVSIATGVNKISSTKATATIDTPEVKGSFNEVIVDYTAGGENIGISTKIDGGAWTAQTVIQDTINKKVYFDGGLGEVNFIQARITLSSTAVISNIQIL